MTEKLNLESANVIEIANKTNSSHIFGPTKEKLRGRWTPAHKAHRDAGPAIKAIARFQFIPGVCLAIDAKAKKAYRFDPLMETPEGRRIWRELEPTLKRYEGTLGIGRPWETATYPLDADSVKSWLFEMRKLVDSEIAIEIKSRLPSMENIIAMPGLRRANYFDNTAMAKKLGYYLEDDLQAPDLAQGRPGYADKFAGASSAKGTKAS